MNRMPTKAEIDAATKLALVYLTTEEELPAEMIALIGNFMNSFFSTAHALDWPVFEEDFPKALRCIAILLEGLHRTTEEN